MFLLDACKEIFLTLPLGISLKLSIAFVIGILIFNFTHLHSQRCITGGRHSIAICENGSVISWGYNGYGQLGDGTSTQQQTVSTVVGVSNVTHISAGLFHSIFITSDGTAYGCGRNVRGQLGDSTLTDKYIPTRLRFLPKVVKSAGGGEHSLFLAEDSTVYGTGLNNSGQLGDGTNVNKIVPVKIPNLTGIIQVACGAEFSLYLKSDGTVWASGHNSYGQLGDGTNKSKLSPVQIPSLQNIVHISAGEWHSLFVKSDGTVWACGRNTLGQLGIEEPLGNINSTPKQVANVSNIIVAEAGGIHSLFLSREGKAYACGLNSGENNYGQLGDGTTVDKRTPSEIQFPEINDKIIHVEAAREHTLLVTSSGTIWGIGRNNYGQIGIGTYTTSNFTIPTLSTDVCNVGVATSVNKFDEQEFASVYPNPVSNELSIELENNLTAELTILSLVGETLYSIETNENRITIDVSTLPKGIYFLSIRQNVLTQMKKIIIQ